jgi:hypothetical protein
MIILHHFFSVFGIDVKELNEEIVKSPADASVAEALPVHIYNEIYANTSLTKYLDIIEANIKKLYDDDNEWCVWMVDLYENNNTLNKDELQEVALLSHDSMARDYIQWELKVHVPIADIIDYIERQSNIKTEKNQGKRKRKKT